MNMGFWQVVLYLRDLIREGHKWQWQNVVGTASKKSFRLSLFQVIGCVLAGWFVYKNPTGVSDNAIDFLLSSMSIITGFFFAVILLSYDQYCKIKMPEKRAGEETKVKVLKSINFLKKYNALSCYAILLALIVIFMLIGTLLFGQKVNISTPSFSVAKSFADINWFTTIGFYALLLWRFSMIYFLFDFFIITVYAICSLFQFLNLQMLERQQPYTVIPTHVTTEYQVYKYKYGKAGVVFVILIGLLSLLLVASLI